MVGKKNVDLPMTKVNSAILEVLKKENFISDYTTEEKKRTINVSLKYDENRKPAITEVKRLSKLSKRIYSGSTEIHSVKNGYGLLVVSTPQGIMSGKDAKENNLGGELMFEIW